MARRMKGFWYIINITIMPLGLLGGYNSPAPEQLRNKNPEAVLSGFLLLGVPIFCLLSVGYSNRWTGKKTTITEDSRPRSSFVPEEPAELVG